MMTCMYVLFMPVVYIYLIITDKMENKIQIGDLLPELPLDFNFVFFFGVWAKL